MGTEQAHKPIRFQHDTGGANGPHDPMRRRPPNEQPMAGNSYDVPLMELARENIVLKHQLHTAQLEMDRLKSLVAAREAKEEDMPAQPRYWTDDEHERFLDALEKFGHKDVKAIANYVGTRNATQVRSHAQKYFMKLAREGKLSDDHNEQDAVGEGSSASGGENPGAQSACEEYKPTSKVRRLEGVRPALRNGNESSTSLSRSDRNRLRMIAHRPWLCFIVSGLRPLPHPPPKNLIAGVCSAAGRRGVRIWAAGGSRRATARTPARRRRARRGPTWRTFSTTTLPTPSQDGRRTTRSLAT